VPEYKEIEEECHQLDSGNALGYQRCLDNLDRLGRYLELKSLSESQLWQNIINAVKPQCIRSLLSYFLKAE
jgi:hypothetical protein